MKYRVMKVIFTHCMIRIVFKLPSIKSKQYNIKKDFSTIWNESKNGQSIPLRTICTVLPTCSDVKQITTKIKTNVELNRKIFYFSFLKPFLNNLTKAVDVSLWFLPHCCCSVIALEPKQVINKQIIIKPTLKSTVSLKRNAL